MTRNALCILKYEYIANSKFNLIHFQLLDGIM